MRPCWIKAGGFVPLDFGGRIRSFQMVKELARQSLTLKSGWSDEILLTSVVLPGWAGGQKYVLKTLLNGRY